MVDNIVVIEEVLETTVAAEIPLKSLVLIQKKQFPRREKNGPVSRKFILPNSIQIKSLLQSNSSIKRVGYKQFKSIEGTSDEKKNET